MDYDTYKAAPSPKALAVLVEAKRRLIDGVVNGLVGQKASPIVRRRAYVLAAQAIKGFDPRQGVPLDAHLRTQLQSVQRMARQVNEAIDIPERVRRDRALLHQTSEKLWDELDREPTDDEIADRSGVSIRRIAKLREMPSGVMGLGQFAAKGTEESGDPGVIEVDPAEEWEDLVYHDLDPVDKRIYDAYTGYRGPQRPASSLAKDLNLSPAAITKRMGSITNRLGEYPRSST